MPFWIDDYEIDTELDALTAILTELVLAKDARRKVYADIVKIALGLASVGLGFAIFLKVYG